MAPNWPVPNSLLATHSWPEVSHTFKNALGMRITLEEERSKDREVRHAKERVSPMTLGCGVFARQVSDTQPDGTALRRR